MADWSELFQQRLQTVFQDDNRHNEKGFESHTGGAFSGLNFDLTPPPTHHKAAPTDPTGAFFESIRNQSRSGGGQAKAVTMTTPSYAVGSGNYAFQYGEPSSVSSRAIITPAAQVIRTTSPTMGIDWPDLKGLQESYSTRAEELHAEAANRMASAQDMLEVELGRMAQKEDAFLSTVADKQAHFSRPAEAWMVKVQTRENNNSGSPVEKEKDERIVDRIATIRAAAATLESDLEKLWAEWGQAHSEATDVLQAMTGKNGDDEDEERDQILAKAQKELDVVATEATKEMKENEKTFKKAIFAEECKLAQMMLSRQSKYD
ncbi:GTPase activating factor [Sporothrix stenoceras]|uniref:GTPase activating factor n=1 Tax=Sporothrix stenoceras TaxID=5173 RepID=A0ABR3ZRP1_9PEZI